MRRRNLLVMLFLALSTLIALQVDADKVLAGNNSNRMCPTMSAQASGCIHNETHSPLEQVESSSPSTGLPQFALANQSESLIPLEQGEIGTPVEVSQVQSTLVNQPEPLITNDPYVDRQWALSKIEASRLWQTTTVSQKVIVAILDTGIDQDHEDLKGKVIDEANFTDSLTSSDIYGHGTHIAGIIAAEANNSVGIVGMAPESQLINVKVADDRGRCQALEVAKGILWAVNSGANVINISVEIRGSSLELEEAVNYAWSHGSLIVAAAGNDGSGAPVYPAVYENCIAVAATKQDDSLAPLSNHSGWVDIAAPGFSIYSTLPDNKYGYKSGTSFACAYVSGMAALLFAQVTDTNGDGWLNDEVRAVIEDGCQEIGIDGVGGGRIDAAKAIAQVSNTS